MNDTTSQIVVRPASVGDSAVWERLRQALWPKPPGVHATKVGRYFNGDRKEPAEVLLAFSAKGDPMGFAEVSLRPYAEGCNTSPVAYLEGWYVEPQARGTGMGRILMKKAEAWGRVQGCKEFASDTQIDNHTSIARHLSLGFSETGRIVCFKKDL